MTKQNFDIDIDVNSNCDKSRYGTRAIIFKKTDDGRNLIQPHPSGYYIESINIDNMFPDFASIDYKDAEELGFNKVDLLTNSSYDMFKSKDEVLEYFHKEIPWDMFEDEEFVQKLPHIANHFWLVSRIKPKSVDDLADCLALIRPGKKHLIEDYLEDKEHTRKNLYLRPKTGMYFKKSHSYSYAMMIVCVANKLFYDDIFKEMGL